MRLIKVMVAGEPIRDSYIDPTDDLVIDISALFDGAEVGDCYILTLVEMDKDHETQEMQNRRL